MLKRRADELAHQCESGDGGGYAAAASSDGEGRTKDLRLCRSCGSQRNVGGERRGGRSSHTNSVASRRPGTAPAKIRRCPRGGGGGGEGVGIAGGDGNSAGAGNQTVFANLVTAAADPCAHQGSSHGSPSPSPCSSGCCCGCARSNQPTGPSSSSRTSPRGAARRPQTAARARGDAASIDNTDDSGGSFAGGGIREQRPARRAQTAGRCRARSAGAPRCSPSAETPPPHPRRYPRDGDGGSIEGAAAMAAAAATAAGSIDERPPGNGEVEETSGEGVVGVDRHPGRAEDAEITAAEQITSCNRQQQTGEGRGEEEALLAKRRGPSRSPDEAKRQPRDGHGSGNSGRRAHGATGNSVAVTTTVVETGLMGDVPLEQGEERIEKESSTATADGRAVQV